MPTLADLFNQSSQDIYKKFSPREEPSSQPYISILPDSDESRSRIKNDTRALPVVSTIRDTKRISKFLRSSDGLLFLSKQTLLQAGNTFVTTKLYNPLSPILNTIPFVHARRHIPTQVIIPNAPGLLQNNTVEDVTSKFSIRGQIQAFSKNERGLVPIVGSIAKTYFTSKLKNVANTIVPLPQNYAESRPEYNVFSDVTGPVVFSPQPRDQRGLPKLGVAANIKNAVISSKRTSLIKRSVTAINIIVPKSLRNKVPVPIPEQTEEEQIPTFVNAAKQFRKNFYDNQLNKFKGDPNNSRIKSKYFYESDDGFTDYGDDPSSIVFGTVKKSKTGLKDPYNIAPLAITFDPNKINYANIVKEQDRNTDIIKFIFYDVDGQNPVYFRALLSSIKESIKPEFSEQRYVGRTERFVTYGGVKRNVNLTFNIVAFSQGERDGMWTKINYLSGLTFPKNVVNGFMVPPLFKITIGGIYDSQPCYIESLDYDFLDESITFDIDKEVPFAINVTMQLSILEKRSKFYDSPFYKIMEEANSNRITEDRRRLQTVNPSMVLTPRIVPNNISAQLPKPRFPATPPTDPFTAGEGVQNFGADGNPIP